MPLLEGALGSALLVKGLATTKGVGLLSGLLQLPVLHSDEHRHDLDSRGGNGFLDTDAALAVPVAHAAAVHAAHADFLFGAVPAQPAVWPASSLLPVAATSGLAAPKLSMMLGATVVAKAIMEVAGRRAPRLDPFEDGRDDEEDPPSGWCKFVPRGLKFFLACDAFSGMILARSLFDTCDWPLKVWLVGGMLLGYPTSQLVHRVAVSRPAFRHYRVTVQRLRDGGDPGGAKLDGIVLYDQFNMPVERAEIDEYQHGVYWYANLRREEAELVTGYHLVTHRSAAPELDPIAWILEGSPDGVQWCLMDQCEGLAVPRERGATTSLLEDLLHLEDSAGAFRSAFLLEVLACAASLSWLVAGTSWVSGGGETCVDSAPLLWYSCYMIVVIVWSCLGTVTIGLIVSAVAMVILGARPPSG